MMAQVILWKSKIWIERKTRYGWHEYELPKYTNKNVSKLSSVSDNKWSGHTNRERLRSSASGGQGGGSPLYGGSGEGGSGHLPQPEGAYMHISDNRMSSSDHLVVIQCPTEWMGIFIKIKQKHAIKKSFPFIYHCFVIHICNKKNQKIFSGEAFPGSANPRPTPPPQRKNK